MGLYGCLRSSDVYAAVFAAGAAAACGYGAPDPSNAVEAGKITKQVDAYITYGASDNTKSIAMR
jgi:hypothetical protein